MIRPRIFLADDHSEFLKLEVALLQPHFELVGTAADGASLVSEVQRLNPDIVVADITMPIMSGIKAVARACQVRLHRQVHIPYHPFQRGIRGSLLAGRRPGIRYKISHESAFDSRDPCGSRWPALCVSLGPSIAMDCEKPRRLLNEEFS